MRSLLSGHSLYFINSKYKPRTMVETHWEDLSGKELRYNGDTWELTGDVDLQESGGSLAVEAKQIDDVRDKKVSLYFGPKNPPRTLNPGDFNELFTELEREDDDQHLVINEDHRTYRYELHRIEYE